jgi:hypothetical protein
MGKCNNATIKDKTRKSTIQIIRKFTNEVAKNIFVDSGYKEIAKLMKDTNRVKSA